MEFIQSHLESRDNKITEIPPFAGYTFLGNSPIYPNCIYIYISLQVGERAASRSYTFQSLVAKDM